MESEMAILHFGNGHGAAECVIINSRKPRKEILQRGETAM